VFADEIPCKSLENDSFTEMCRGSEAGSYLRPMVFMYHSTLGVRVMIKKKSLELSYGGRPSWPVACLMCWDFDPPTETGGK